VETKNSFYQHRSQESTTVTHQYGAQQSQVCPTENEVGLHLNKVEETWRNKYFFTFLSFLSCPGRLIIISLAVRRTTHDIHYIPIWYTFFWTMCIKSV